ncbi:MAG: acyltransferase [Candidatus Hydrogenedentes bacterium]|nr:acyltransferase [Candidatus Hydrogenedentota bacterium]
MNALRSRWRLWRLRRQVERMGRDVQFLGTRIEVKGHIELGDRCILGEGVVLRTHKQGRIVIGEDVEIADFALIQCNALLEIGGGTRLGEYCVIRDTNHVMRGTSLHWRLTPHVTEPITIGPNCYLGAHVYISPGVTIGEGAVVGPGSVVSKNIGAFEIWAGYPASFIAHRTEQRVQTTLRRHLDLVSMFGVTAPEES